MSMTDTVVKEWGNSLGIILPKKIVKHDGIKKGDTIKIDIITKKRVDGFGMWKGMGLPPFVREYDDEHENLF